MNKQILSILLLLLLHPASQAQKTILDSNLTDYEKRVLDSLDKDLNEFLKGGGFTKSFFDASFTGANGYYDFKNNNYGYLNTSSRLTLLPALAYYHKSGWSVSATGCGVYDSNSFNFYQFILSPSYEYTSNDAFSTGVVYSHFFNKDSLPFYTTPVNNEVFMDFVWRKGWLQPAFAAALGWGSRKTYRKEATFIRALLARARGGIPGSTTEEAVRDLALSFSLKHDFSWHHLFSKQDLLLFIPQVMVTAGTQHYGFNTNYNFGSHIVSSSVLLYHADINDNTGLSFQSLACMVRLDYALHHFYLEPEIILDYSLPYSTDTRFRQIAAIAAGFNF